MYFHAAHSIKQNAKVTPEMTFIVFFFDKIKCISILFLCVVPFTLVYRKFAVLKADGLTVLNQKGIVTYD